MFGWRATSQSRHVMRSKSRHLSPLLSLMRRVPALRWCALQYARRVREKQREASWAYVQSVLTTVGNMTITWAGIELMLNTLIEWYQGRVGQVIRPELPRNFADKLEYLRKMEPDVRWAADDRAKLRAIRIELKRLNEFRKEIIHGLLHQKNSRSTEWHVYSVREKGSKLVRSSKRYSNDDIQDFSRAMSSAANEISPFFAKLIDIPHPANLHRSIERPAPPRRH